MAIDSAKYTLPLSLFTSITKIFAKSFDKNENLPHLISFISNQTNKSCTAHYDLTFLASCVSGLVPAKSVNQLLMELCDLAVTSQKLSFWLTCGLRFPVSGNVLYRSFSAMMLLKFELI